MPTGHITSGAFPLTHHRWIAAAPAGAAFAALLAGCVGPLVLVTRVEESTAVELNATIPVYDARPMPPSASILGPITATSCKNKMWDKDATNEDATSQLRLMSRQSGGNAVGNLVRAAPRPSGTTMKSLRHDLPIA
jgi:hypothetical protein